MSTTPEIETVARAISEADTRARLGAVATRVDMSRNYLHQRDACLAMARAALLAIREPTERMLSAGGRVHDENSPFTKARVRAFQDMIDAALGDRPTS